MVDVNHLTGHVLAHFIKVEGKKLQHLAYPFLCLLVSGWKLQIVLVKAYNDMEIWGRLADDGPLEKQLTNAQR